LARNVTARHETLCLQTGSNVALARFHATQRVDTFELLSIHCNSPPTNTAMSTRARHSTASVAPSPSQCPRATQADYERPSFTLNPEAQRALADLTRKHNLKQLDNKFEAARDAILNSAGEINERLNNKEVAGRKLRQRQQAASQNGDAGAGANELIASVEADLEQMREKVDKMTKRMEEGMRRMIDGRLAVEQMKESVASAADSARAEASTQASTLATRSQARRRRGGDDEDENEEEEEEYQDFTPTDPAGGTQAVASVSEGWMRKLEDEKIKYQSLSLGQRYAKDNDYVNFKGIVHSSRFPDGEVELPHASAWFTANGAAPQPGVTGVGGEEDDDDDDIQIQRTKTSTKCPLTLREFKEPVTSSKCKHSFEASAIMEMIQLSSETVGGQPARRGGGSTGGEKAVRCPVASCNHMLTKNDLQKDKTIMYHIARLQRARRLEEDDDDDGDENSGRQAVDLIDSDAPDVDDFVAEPVMKREPKGSARSRASVAPRSSRAGGMRDADGDETMEQW
jgi:hypothetical protein